MNQNLSLEVVKGWKLELSEYEGLPMSVEYNLVLSVWFLHGVSLQYRDGGTIIFCTSDITGGGPATD